MSAMEHSRKPQSASARSLDQIQKWMQAVVMHPAGVEQGTQAAGAQAHIAIGPDELDRVVNPSNQLTSRERLGIYNRAYYARLIDCLAEQFPVLLATVGEEAFAQFALAYLQAYPSTSYTLYQLAADFATHLAETRPPRVANDDGDADWPDLLIDIARLEWALHEVFDGPGPEGRPLLDVEALRRIPAERWGDARITPIASLRLVELSFPLNEYFTSVRRDENVKLPTPARSFVALVRREYRVRRHDLSHVQYALLAAIQDGLRLYESIERATEACQIAPDEEDFATKLRDWFYGWTAAGFFENVHVDGI